MRFPVALPVRTRALFVVACIVAAALQVAGAAAAAADRSAFPPSLHRLADEADAVFLDRFEPDPATMTMFDLAGREKDFAVRRYVVAAHAAAIDGLLVESMRPGQQARVERILRQLERVAKSSDAEPLLGEAMARELARAEASPEARAQAIRNTVAITELPMALADAVGNAAAALRIAQDPPAQQAARAVAARAYQRAAAAEPDNPWNWIVLAWLTDGDAGLAAAKTASMLPAYGTDADAAVALMLRAAQLQSTLKQPEKAENLLKLGLKAALEKARRTNDADDRRQATIVANALGELHHAMHDDAKATRLYRWSLGERDKRVRAEARSTASLIDLLAVHERLAMVPPEYSGSAVNEDFTKALDLDAEVRRRSPLTPVLGPQSWAVMALAATVIGTLLTLLAGLLLLALYRRRVGRLMTAASVASSPGEPIVQDVLPATEPRPAASRPHSRARATIAMRWTLGVQAVAALAFAAVAVGLLVTTGDIDPTVKRFIILMTPWTWPIVFVYAFLLAGDRKRLLAVIGIYFAVVAIEAIWVGLGPTTPMQVAGTLMPGWVQVLFLWVSFSASTVILPLFLNRSVRAIGPILMVFMIVTSVGGMFAMVAGSTYVGTRWRLAIEAALHIGSRQQTGFEFVVGMLVFAPLAWLLIASIRRLYIARWISDQSLVIDAIWLLQALSLILQYLIFDVGRFAWIGLAPFVAYKAVAMIGMAIAAHRRGAQPPARLLMLRVFGFQRRTERFFDTLAMRWRYIGPIQVVAAPDLAGKTIDPEELMDFLGGRLRRRFIIEPDDLQRRLAAADDRADVFGIYRVNDFFCGKDTWRATVEALMRRSDMVVMDLRGFSSNSLGCIYEIEALQNSVPADRIVMLTDSTTDEALLRTTLADSSGRLVASSPNRACDSAIEFLKVGGSDIDAVDTLLKLADERLVKAR